MEKEGLRKGLFAALVHCCTGLANLHTPCGVSINAYNVSEVHFLLLVHTICLNVHCRDVYCIGLTTGRSPLPVLN